MFRYFIALYFCVYSFSGLSHKPVPVSKSFIVAFSKPMEAHILQEASGFRFRGFEALNLSKTFFKATYDSGWLAESEALRLLYALPNVEVVQEDGPIYLRNTTPNDTLLGFQWHLNMIKALQAWDLTRGGVNRRGDTIVIAVVDDGLHVNHPDFKGNIWINYAENDTNGLDDDGNGFIDDRYGWNFMGNNNDISDSTNYNAKHGTRVSGVIGATGNDVTGVSGILWKVKLMYSNIADTSNNLNAVQSNAIKAYDYVLQQRKLYNSTNGAKGAFVIAVNSSWGYDKKFASQAPLWCAMYDSMGREGIITAGATTNFNDNVDEVGDLPSTCPSQHLIVVSSVNKNDIYANRGYGTVNVDINAPGEGIFTTYAYTTLNQMSGLYGSSFSGTSAATPMVAAAVGLLNTYACEKLMDVIKSDPEEANLLIRRFILEGVDELPSLAGKNATTGRLNILKSMQVMDQYCYGLLNQNDLKVLKDVVIYPNPGKGILNIETFYPLIKVECRDATGRMVECNLSGNTMDISWLAKGVYYFRVETAEGTSALSYVKND